MTFNEKINITLVVPSLDQAAGGPTRTVVGLARTLAKDNERVSVELVSQRLKVANAINTDVGLANLNIGLGDSTLSLKLGIPSLSILRSFSSPSRFQIIHSNGIWHPVNHWATRLARHSNIPLVIQPRGMLEPWALKWHAKRKQVALRLYQLRDLNSATLFIATSKQEAENIRNFGLSQPIAVVSNGIDLQACKWNVLDKSSRTGRNYKALFLSRVHPKKGLENLIRAWALIKPDNWILQIAGPDEDGHLAQILLLAKNLGISYCIEYLGELNDHKKWAVFYDADLFILPTYSENFGVVVAEALSCGVPVITTTGTPWADLKTYGCGWWVEIGVEPLVVAIKAATALTNQERYEMGVKGYEYVKRYNWESIASEMMSVYKWMLKIGPKPDCINIS